MGVGVGVGCGLGVGVGVGCGLGVGVGTDAGVGGSAGTGVGDGDGDGGRVGVGVGIGVGCDSGVGVGTGVGVGGSVGTGVGDGKREEDERDVSECTSQVRPPPATANPAIPIKTVRRETPCFGGTTDVGGGEMLGAVSVVLSDDCVISLVMSDVGAVSVILSGSEAGGAETGPGTAVLPDVETTGTVASSSSSVGA